MRLSNIVTQPELLGDFMKKIRLAHGCKIEDICENLKIEIEHYIAIEENKVFDPDFEIIYWVFKCMEVDMDEFDWGIYFQLLNK